MEEVETPKVKVGDELAFSWYRHGYVIYKVASISRSGRISMDTGSRVELVLDPDLKVRGAHQRRIYGYRAEHVTPDIREWIEAEEARSFLVYKFENWLRSNGNKNPKVLIKMKTVIKELMDSVTKDKPNE